MNRREYRSKKFGSWEHSQSLDAQVAAAKLAGLTIRHDLMARTPNTFKAHRLIWLAQKEGAQDAVVEALFRAHFAEGRDVGDTSVLIEIANEAGIAEKRARAFLESAEGADEVRREMQKAIDSGISGVPTFIFDGKALFSGALKPAMMADRLLAAAVAMPNAELRSLRALVAGGSIGSLCAGLALHNHGANVEIFERNPGPMETRGAGIVVQPALTEIVQRYAASSLPTTSCSGRRYLDPDGGDGLRQHMLEQFTSWESIYLTPRAAFPNERYHNGTALERFENAHAKVFGEITGHGTVSADLLVCADGAQSETRRDLLPQVQQHYAGYIAWRGTVSEAAVPQSLAAFFDDTFTFSEARSGGDPLVEHTENGIAGDAEARP